MHEQHGEREDERGVDLHVEPRAEVGRRAGAPRDPAVDGVQREGHRREDGRGSCGPAGDREDGDAAGEHGADQGDAVGGAQPRNQPRNQPWNQPWNQPRNRARDRTEGGVGVHTLIHVRFRPRVRPR
jgi:hypothetical protein